MTKTKTNKDVNWVNLRHDNRTLKLRIDELEKRIKHIEQQIETWQEKT